MSAKGDGDFERFLVGERLVVFSSASSQRPAASAAAADKRAWSERMPTTSKAEPWGKESLCMRSWSGLLDRVTGI